MSCQSSFPSLQLSLIDEVVAAARAVQLQLQLQLRLQCRPMARVSLSVASEWIVRSRSGSERRGEEERSGGGSD